MQAEGSTDVPHPISVSYLATALRDIDRLLEAARQEPDPVKQQALEVKAGKRSCEALLLLNNHEQLWDALRAQCDERIRDWNDLRVPVVAELLEALGYTPSSDDAALEDLITLGTQVLREAAGLPSEDRDLTIEARSAIAEIRLDVCALKDAAATRHRRRKAIVASRKLLLGVLLASVVNPQVQQGLRDLGPQAVDMMH